MRNDIRLNQLNNITLSSFHTAPEWSDIFNLLVAAIKHEPPDILGFAVETAAQALWAEKMQAYRQKDFKPGLPEQRLPGILKAIALRGEQIPLIIEAFCYHTQIMAEDKPYRSLILQWLDELEHGKKTKIGATSLLTAKIILKVFGHTWSKAKDSLLSFLDHDDLMVRAYAADQIGQFYAEDESMPPLDSMMDMVKQKDIERPGIAGPFWGAICFDFENIKKELNPEIYPVEWMFDILKQRKSAEPELRHFNGIDFYAHELFAGSARLIQRLIDLHRTDIAIAAATEWRDKIEALEPILVKLGYNNDQEIVRQASWHLAYHYHNLHPHGEELGFVERLSELEPIDIFINYSKPGFDCAYAAVIYPKNSSELLADKVAWEWVDKIIPIDIRGPIAINVLSPAKSIDPVILGNSLGLTYRQGAIITFYGFPDKKQWKNIHIIWHGKKNLWNPKSHAVNS